jgi:hypothetical protein
MRRPPPLLKDGLWLFTSYKAMLRGPRITRGLWLFTSYKAMLRGPRITRGPPLAARAPCDSRRRFSAARSLRAIRASYSGTAAAPAPVLLLLRHNCHSGTIATPALPLPRVMLLPPVLLPLPKGGGAS